MCRTLALISVVAAPDGKSIYVTTGRGQGVVIIDTATNKPVASIEVGGRPRGIAVSADGRTVFTANGPSNDVSIVDVASRTVKAKVTVGDRPWGVAFIP
jgi:YVTN family beta-propeller protein